MLEPLAVDPNRSVAPAANSMASARLVFPAPAGPTSAITRVPLDGCPAMRLSLRALRRASRSQERRSGACLETSTVRLFGLEGKRARYGSGLNSGTLRLGFRFEHPWLSATDVAPILTGTMPNPHGPFRARVGDR